VVGEWERMAGGLSFNKSLILLDENTGGVWGKFSSKVLTFC